MPGSRHERLHFQARPPVAAIGDGRRLFESVSGALGKSSGRALQRGVSYGAATVFLAFCFTRLQTSSISSQRVAILPIASLSTKRPFRTVWERKAFPEALMLSSNARFSSSEPR